MFHCNLEMNWRETQRKKIFGWKNERKEIVMIIREPENKEFISNDKIWKITSTTTLSARDFNFHIHSRCSADTLALHPIQGHIMTVFFFIQLGKGSNMIETALQWSSIFRSFAMGAYWISETVFELLSAYSGVQRRKNSFTSS